MFNVGGVEIDTDGAEYPYRQLAALLRARIRSGQYPAGRAIPSVARLVQETGLSKNTVIKAVDQLAAAGLVVKVRSRGTFVR